MIAVSGVRSSWLILARKVPFARLDDSAAIRACSNRQNSKLMTIAASTIVKLDPTAAA